jgi:hypothetical protein|tara:strand:+ start:917 stop:1099 length:183 start_codon:yes stop_codon:yes gene_type:complete
LSRTLIAAPRFLLKDEHISLSSSHPSDPTKEEIDTEMYKVLDLFDFLGLSEIINNKNYLR